LFSYATRHNISIQTKLDFEDREGSERCEHTIEDGTNINQIHSEDIRNKDSISINKQEKNNKNNFKNNKYSQTENISNDEDQVALSEEHSQRSRIILFINISVTRFIHYFYNKNTFFKLWSKIRKENLY